jgi:thymidylate synthase
MNKLDLEYQYLVRYILENGVEKKDRTGTGTKSTFGWQIRHKMSDGFPLLTTKKVFWKGVVGELLWFLRGDTNIKYLVDNDCHIWDGDAYQSYCKRYWELDERDKIEYGSSYYNHETNEYEFETYSKEEFVNYIKTDDEFAKEWGELGPVYGKQWRSWERYGYRGVQNGALDCGLITMEEYKKEKYIDQIANLIHDLKTNPDSRRLMVSAWNVGELDSMVLPPCHYGFQVYTRELSTKERLKLWIDRCTDIEWKNGLEEAYYDWDNPRWVHGVFETDMDDAEIPTRAISLMWNQRSCDVGLGAPFNIASYGLLLEILAKATNMVPYELIGNLGDCHLYSNHIEPIQEQLTREPFNLPTLNINTEFWPTQSGECGVGELTDNVDSLIRNMEIGDFTLENYTAHPAIKLPLSN